MWSYTFTLHMPSWLASTKLELTTIFMECLEYAIRKNSNYFCFVGSYILTKY